MTDNGFHLTPIDVRSQEFPIKFRGYDPAAVEEFRNRVADEMERLLRERIALDERVQNFREQLKAFREREKAMSEALVAAQQLRVDAEHAAQKAGEQIIRDAHSEAERLLAEARDLEKTLRRDHASAQRQFSGYLAGFRSLLERNLAEVEALEVRDHNSGAPREGM